jgi:serine/threonine-protein kinase
VALVPESRPPTNEIQALLRKRLLVVAAIFLLAATLGATLPLLAGPPWPGWPLPLLALLLPFIAVSAASLAWLLRAGRSLSLPALRGIELVLFGSLALGMVVIVVGEGQGALLWCARRGAIGMSHGARFAGLPWFAGIVIYGVLIPNTWRRCAAVVGVTALAPLALHTAIGLADRTLDRGLLLVFLLEMALWMSIGVAIAVFGSHHLAVLRREAFEARKLGQYQLRRRLGAGGMGEVYLAEHVLLRRPCAVKLIRPEQAGDPKNLLRFEREVRTTATLTHPNTVQIFDYGHAEDGTFYYVMEHLPGLTLDQLVTRHGPLSPGRAIHFLRQLCGALQEAHAVGLIHRDIKPGNVIVCKRGGVHDTAKLLDFGLVLPPAGSPDSDKLTQEGAVTGTPAYMSPEQAGGQDNLDARSDIYSVGALAYFLLTGRPPFADRSPVRMLAAHLYEFPAPLTQHRPDVPGDLQAVVLRCLAKEPAARYADAESLETALASCPAAGAWSAKEAARWWRWQATANEASSRLFDRPPLP